MPTFNPPPPCRARSVTASISGGELLNVRYGWIADIEFAAVAGQQARMQPATIQKHIFYGTVLILLYLGSLSSVFRADIESKVVTIVCATVLFVLSVLFYISHRARFR